jgi:hypothetical protein
MRTVEEKLYSDFAIGTTFHADGKMRLFDFGSQQDLTDSTGSTWFEIPPRALRVRSWIRLLDRCDRDQSHELQRVARQRQDHGSLRESTVKVAPRHREPESRLGFSRSVARVTGS